MTEADSTAASASGAFAFLEVVRFSSVDIEYAAMDGLDDEEKAHAIWARAQIEKRRRNDDAQE